MKTVLETEVFQRKSSKIWNEEERLDFIDWIAVNFNSGAVIANTNGLRKVRWSVKGAGKRGGTRVIYLNVDADSVILIDMYKKSEKENW